MVGEVCEVLIIEFDGMRIHLRQLVDSNQEQYEKRLERLFSEAWEIVV